MGWKSFFQAASDGARDGIGAYARGGATGGISELLGASAKMNAQRRLRAQMLPIALRAFRQSQALGSTALQDTHEEFEPRYRAYQERREADARWRTTDSGEVRRGRDLQYDDGKFKVSVTNGYDRALDEYVTDVIVIERDPQIGHHLHVTYHEDGTEITNQWNANH